MHKVSQQNYRRFYKYNFWGKLLIEYYRNPCIYVRDAAQRMLKAKEGRTKNLKNNLKYRDFLRFVEKC